MTYTLPYLPEPTTVQSYLWLTDVLKSDNGLEQRIVLDAGVAAERIEWTVSFGDAASLLALREQLFADPVSPVYLPAAWEELTVRATTTTSITIDGTYADWPAIGAQILLVKSDGTALQVAASAVSGFGTSTCVLTVSPNPTGYLDAAVFPLRLVQLDDGIAANLYHVNGGTVALRGSCTTYLATQGTGASLTNFDSLPVINRRLVGSRHVEQFRSEAEMLDFGGAFYARWGKTHADIARSMRIYVGGAADRQWVRLLGKTLRGRQGLFLLPTWQADLTLNSQPAGGATSLVVVGNDYVTYYWPSLAHRRLQLSHADGTVEYAKVTAAVDNGNGTSTLTLNAGVSGTTITMISLLEQARLNSDEIRFEWASGWNGRVEMEALVVQR